MALALQLAAIPRGFVEPNPMVGCVLARDGQIIGQGYHRKFGGPHAEVEALRDCRSRGVDPAGSDVYVTLEPCSHFGKTPPCAEALIEAKVGRVFAAMIDPFEKVAGQGAAKLRAAGIAVEIGVCEKEARQLNEPFIKRVTTGLPWVIVKWASTVDGRIATRAGRSRWISNAQSRRRVHELRARVDAVMVGIGTALADDPQLTARDVEIRRVARRVIIDPRLRLPLDSKLIGSLRDSDAAPVVLAFDQALEADLCSRIAPLQDAGATLVGLPRSKWNLSRLALRPLLESLSREHGASNVLVGGGANLTGALREQELVDQVLVHVGPRVLGDDGALGAVSGLARPEMQQATELELRQVSAIDGDVELDYRVIRQSSSPPISP